MTRLTKLSDFKVGQEIHGLPTGCNRRANTSPTVFKVTKLGRKYVWLEHTSGGWTPKLDCYLPETGVTQSAIQNKIGSPDRFDFYPTADDLAAAVEASHRLVDAKDRLRLLIYRELTQELADDLLAVFDKHGIRSDD